MFSLYRDLSSIELSSIEKLTSNRNLRDFGVRVTKQISPKLFIVKKVPTSTPPNLGSWGRRTSSLPGERLTSTLPLFRHFLCSDLTTHRQDQEGTNRHLPTITIYPVMSCVGFFPFLVSVSTCNDWTSLDPVSDRVVVLEDLNLVERLYWVTEVSEGCFGTFD